MEIGFFLCERLNEFRDGVFRFADYNEVYVSVFEALCGTRGWVQPK